MTDQVDVRTRRVAQGAVAAATMFASGCLVVQQVVVRRRWLSMTPQDFLTDFRRRGPRIGMVLAPIELVATVLLGVTTRRTARQGSPGGATWAAATTREGATVALLLVYFGRANLALIDPAFPVADAPAELRRWQRWNALRTLLATLAAILAVRGAVLLPGDRADAGRARPALPPSA